MKLLRKQMLLCSILFLVFTLSACSAIGQTDENNLTDSATSAAKKRYTVVRGSNYSNRFNANDYCSGSTVYYFLTRKWHI